MFKRLFTLLTSSRSNPKEGPSNPSTSSHRGLFVGPEVLEAQDDDLVWLVIGPAYDAVSIYDGPEVLAHDLALLTPGQRALLALHWTDCEVSNGGFGQYFWNSTGILASEAEAGCQLIGATATAELIARVMARFPGGNPSKDRGERISWLESLDGSDRDALFDDDNNRFYELNDTEMFPKAAAYVRANPSQFIRP